MIYPYPSNDTSLKVEYHRVREGPNWIMVYYKNVATGCHTVKEVKARLGPAKFLDSSKKLYAWLEEMISQYGDSQEESVPDTSFASDTKMVI